MDAPSNDKPSYSETDQHVSTTPSSANRKKNYFIIFSIPTVIRDWAELYNPEEHELFCISTIPFYENLKRSNQLKYFTKVSKISSIKYEEIKKKVGEIISELEKNGIARDQIKILTDGEFALLKSARLREDFQLNGPKPENIIQFRNKIEAKKKLNDLKKFLHKYIKFDPDIYQKNPDEYVDYLIKELGFPMFAKPFDLVSSIGATKIGNANELNVWLKKNKNNYFLEIDEYVKGNLYYCDSFVRDGKILRSTIGFFQTPLAEDMAQEKLVARIDLQKNDPTWQKIYNFNEIILEHLNPPNGCVHLELFKTPDEKLIFLECAARSPGWNTPDAHKISTGIDFHLTHLKLQMGLDVVVSGKDGPYTASGAVYGVDGILDKQYELTELSSKCVIDWHNRIGDRLNKLRRSEESVAPQFVCSFIMANHNYEALKKDFENLPKQVFYAVSETTNLEWYLRDLMNG